MPKLPKAFGRRKSTTNALEEAGIEAPVNQHTFKVFERHDPGSKSYDPNGKLRVNGRPSIDPEKDDNLFSGFSNRGSGTSNTNTISTTDNSSRLSAVSTASSSDLPMQPDHTYNKNHGAPIPPIPKSTSKFSLKSTGRAFSFGRKQSLGAGTSSPTKTHDDHSKPSTPKDDTRPSTVSDSVKSDYASTTTSPKIENRLSLGGDFSTMFAGIGNRKSAVVLDADNSRDLPEIPTDPSSQATLNSRQSGFSRKTPGNDRSLGADNSSYGWGGQKSAEKERLMFSTSPLPSPSETPPPPPVPKHDSPANETKSTQRPGGFANGGLRRSSAFAGKRQSQLAVGDAEDEDAKLLRESMSAMKRLDVDDAPRVRDSWIHPSMSTAHNGESSTKPARPNFNDANPRPRYPAAEPQEDNLFDHQIAASASLALQWGAKPEASPIGSGPKMKVMTTAQFEKYRQEQERTKNVGGKLKDEEDQEDDAYEDEDETEEEKRREQARQRRKQEAHMTVYRQQMMKITGESSMSPGRPGMLASQSAPNLHFDADNQDEEEDEDVPLAILAAHGFPNKNRAPGQLHGMSSNPNLRAAGSQMSAYPPGPASAAGGGDARGSMLPAFARRLPQDPYYGAGLVNGSNRESLAMGSGSQYGGPPRPQPGGLVGVIASEERSRALRRGSPNTAGEYPGMQGMGYNGLGAPPQNMRASAMGMQFPPTADPAQMQAQMAQMQAQLQQSMEMQFQFFQMMAGAPPPGMAGGPGMPPPGMQGMPPGMPQQGGGFPRASTMGNLGSFGAGFPAGPGSRPQSSAGILDLNAPPTRSSFMPMGGGGGYAPSIAPSERSNVGMPGRYRPVTQGPVGADSRSSTMSGALGGWGAGVVGTANGGATNGVSKNPARMTLVETGEREEDEEEGWAEMRRKREKKKSMWRLRKDKSGGMDDLGELAQFTS